jgi:hypothetical protein
MPKQLAWIPGIAVVVIAAAQGVMAYPSMRSHGVAELSAPCHAAALMNGQVYFGRVDALGTEYTVLRDVYYIQSRQNPETKQVTNILVKRGGEWHGPDRMILNRQQVLPIEPVKDGSQFAKLVAEQSKQPR